MSAISLNFGRQLYQLLASAYQSRNKLLQNRILVGRALPMGLIGRSPPIPISSVFIPYALDTIRGV